MGAYQCRTGLLPIGEHRLLADELFHSPMVLCQDCSGEGLVTLEGNRWEFCPTCEGNCAIFTGTQQEFDEITAQIIKKYPKARIAPPTTMKKLTGRANERRNHDENSLP
jgi:hypothetical protein